VADVLHSSTGDTTTEGGSAAIVSPDVAAPPVTWWWIAALALLIAISLARVAATHRVFSATADEPVHIASGYEWITRGVYIFDPEHPPLARALFGLGLRASGVIAPPPENWSTLQPTWLAAGRGMDLLWHRGEYENHLASARRPNLLFLLAALIAVAVWARRLFGSAVALLAVALFGALPPILAHAGLATTDMAAAATLPIALLALERWLARPTLLPTIVLGVAMGLGLASKMSFLLFFAVGAAVTTAFAGWQRAARLRLLAALVAAVIAMLVLWSLYRFELGTMQSISANMPELAAKIAGKPGAWFAEHATIPAPTFAVGIVWTKVHQERGHAGFLLGETRTNGWWSYFPIALAVKTPLPFLVLFLFGAVRLALRGFGARVRDGMQHVVIPIALLISVMPASMNIGVRHVLVVYPSMAIVAAFGAMELWRFSNRTVGRAAFVAVLAWHFVVTAVAHPDYLAWFNELAGAHPERILGDSNLDWGQDVLRLAEVAREERIDSMAILLFGPAGFDRPLPPHQELPPGIPTQGWVAVSETPLQFAPPGDYAWLTNRPFRRVGKTIRLYFVK
jgi:4-amino-4-deoxy-L-arabinose transferase-like glycosyltransferase